MLGASPPRNSVPSAKDPTIGVVVAVGVGGAAVVAVGVGVVALGTGVVVAQVPGFQFADLILSFVSTLAVSDDAILVGGMIIRIPFDPTNPENGASLAIARFTASGTLDTGFGGFDPFTPTTPAPGWAIEPVEFSSGNPPQAITVQPDGGILLAEYSRLTRFTAAG